MKIRPNLPTESSAAHLVAPIPRNLSQKTKSVILVSKGNARLARQLQEIFDKSHIPMQTKVDLFLQWPRDCHVVLLDKQTHLIPAFFDTENPLHNQFALSFLPRSLLHFYQENLSFIGTGCAEKSRWRAVALAKEFSISYKETGVCLEGGNCRIFQGGDGKLKAVIGYTSVLLSLVSLFYRNYFVGRLDDVREIDPSTPLPDEDLLRIARNVYYTANCRGCILDLPPSASFSLRLIRISRLAERMIDLTKKKIAKELEIPLERIAFVAQQSFHIDMELFAGPRDLVFVHDNHQMLELQYQIGVQRMPFLKRTLRYSEKQARISREILAINEKILEKIGCKMVRVPGVLTASYQPGEILSYSHILLHWMDSRYDLYQEETKAFLVKKQPASPIVMNFMNGLFISEPHPHFITTGVPKHPNTLPFVEAFCSKVHAVCPEMRISFVEGGAQKSLTKRDGGLHCLTSQIS